MKTLEKTLEKKLSKKERELKTLKNSILGILFENKNGFISNDLMKVKIENLIK